MLKSTKERILTLEYESYDRDLYDTEIIVEENNNESETDED